MDQRKAISLQFLQQIALQCFKRSALESFPSLTAASATSCNFMFAGCTNLQECPKLIAAAADNLKLSEMSGRKERGQQEKMLNPNLLDAHQIQNLHQTQLPLPAARLTTKLVQMALQQQEILLTSSSSS